MSKRSTADNKHDMADFGAVLSMSKFATVGDYWKARAERAEKLRESLADRCDALADNLRECLVDLRAAQKNAASAAKTDPRWDGVSEAIRPRIDAAEAALRNVGITAKPTCLSTNEH